MNLGKSFFFLLFIFSIPILLGKHFWLESSFVNGIRVDYLSPTLYFSDIILVFLLLISFNSYKKKIIKLISNNLFIYIFIVLIISSLVSVSFVSSFLKLLKLFELFVFGLFVSCTFDNKIKNNFIYILTLGGLIQCIILFLQFFSQHSLDGVFYYLGERTINASSIGAAVFSFNNTLVLRPYGTFPHPNVLAFYLLFPFTYLLFSFSDKQYKIVKLFALLFLFIGIIFTFSRIVILLSLLILCFYIFTQGKKFRKVFIYLGIILIFVLGGLLFNRFTQSLINDLLLRTDLLKIAIHEFIKHPVFGIGLNNFFFHEILYQKEIIPTLLQPVHNIYILWLVETGILGGIGAYLILKKTYNKAIVKLKNKDNFYIATSLLFFSALIIGIFDHYLITLQQGQILFALIIGLIWVNIMEKE